MGRPGRMRVGYLANVWQQIVTSTARRLLAFTASARLLSRDPPVDGALSVLGSQPELLKGGGDNCHRGGLIDTQRTRDPVRVVFHIGLTPIVCVRGQLPTPWLCQVGLAPR